MNCRQFIIHSVIADKMADFLVIFVVVEDSLALVMTLWLENEGGELGIRIKELGIRIKELGFEAQPNW